MACNPILSLSNQCGKSVIAGVAQLYVIGHSFLAPISGSTEVFAIAENEVVNEIALSGATKFVKVGLLPNTVAITDNKTFDPASGISTHPQSLTLPISNIGVDSRKFVKSVTEQPVVALIKLTSGVWVAMGLEGMMYVTEAAGAVSGTANGYTLTFTSVGGDFTYTVDPTIIPSLIA